MLIAVVNIMLSECKCSIFRASARLRIGDYDGVVEDCLIAIQIDDTNVKAYSRLGFDVSMFIDDDDVLYC